MRILLVDNENITTNRNKRVRKAQKRLDKSGVFVLELCLRAKRQDQKLIIIAVRYYTCFTFIPTLPLKVRNNLHKSAIGALPVAE